MGIRATEALVEACYPTQLGHTRDGWGTEGSDIWFRNTNTNTNKHKYRHKYKHKPDALLSWARSWMGERMSPHWGYRLEDIMSWFQDIGAGITNHHGRWVNLRVGELLKIPNKSTLSGRKLFWWQGFWARGTQLRGSVAKIWLCVCVSERGGVSGGGREGGW